jgi:hypothetical protein
MPDTDRAELTPEDAPRLLRAAYYGLIFSVLILSAVWLVAVPLAKLIWMAM